MTASEAKKTIMEMPCRNRRDKQNLCKVFHTVTDNYYRIHFLYTRFDSIWTMPKDGEKSIQVLGTSTCKKLGMKKSLCAVIDLYN